MTSYSDMKFPGYKVVEQLGETRHSSVYRARKKGDDGTVIIKVIRIKDPSPSMIARFRHEYEIIRNLSIDGIVKPVDLITFDGSPAMVLEDFGGVSLKTFIEKGFSTDRFLSLSIRMAEILGEIHKENITHKDIKPHNILLNMESDILKITDFGISADMTHIKNDITEHAVLEGTLSYISPEQTGRMNCAVDYRTDLYSLGVTFYEMLTGKTPFPSGDPMEIIHAHIAMEPVPPSIVQPGIPSALSHIVMKLLAKSASDRYQNALGLAADLEECRRQLRMSGMIQPFTLGTKDIAPFFDMGDYLLGRTEQLQVLKEAYNQACRGSVATVLVKGEPGIGKSTLVNRSVKSIVTQGGRYITGKFDQFQNSVPYSAIIQSFQGLIRQLLSESDETLRDWKNKLLKALGENGKIIADIIPEIETIIGAQPDVPELKPEETQNRFHFVFRNFVHVFADKNHPLVFFLDDLQWADSASVHLVLSILTDKTIRHLLFIGAYRDSDIAGDHPLFQARDTLIREEINVETLQPEPLNPYQINTFLSSRLGCEPEYSLPLSSVIFEKTKGNPFFVNQFVKTLYDRNLFALDHRGFWTWNIRDIRAVSATDNVVSFLAEKLKNLPEEAKEIIGLAACIGNTFDPDILKSISGRSMGHVLTTIDTLIRKGLVVQNEDEYQFYHDRVQEAAYGLLSSEARVNAHYAIGMLDLDRTPSYSVHKRIYYICDQLNKALARNLSSDQKQLIAELNLKAGIKAKDSTAYAAAVNYLGTGASLLSEDSWVSSYNLTYALNTELMECQYLHRNLEESEQLFGIIKKHAANKLDLARAYNTMIVLYTTTRTDKEAIAIGIEALKLFGVDLDPDVGVGPVVLALFKARYRLKKINPDAILGLPVITDEKQIAVSELLLNIGVPTFYMNPNLFALICVKALNDLLSYGLSPHAGVGLIVAANIIQTSFKDYTLAYRLGEAALELNQRFNNRKISAVVLHTFAYFLVHWKKHVRHEVDIYAEAYDLAMNSGNYIYAGHSICASAGVRLMIGHRIDDILNELNRHNDFIKQVKDPHIVVHYHMITNWVMTLKGYIPLNKDLATDDFDLSESIENARQKSNLFGLCYMLFMKMLLRIWQQKFDEAYTVSEDLDRYIKAPMGTLVVADHCFYQSLVMITLLKNGETRRKRKFRTRINSHIRKLFRWSKECPENFKHKHDLLVAELASLNGRFHSAVEHYHSAIRQARGLSFLSVEALTCELFASFYLSHDHKEEAGVFIMRAYRIYMTWGATARADILKNTYPTFVSFVTPAGTRDSQSGNGTTTSSDPVVNNMDFSTVMKVSQVISGEIRLDRLLEKILHISMVNAGAQRGFLIFESNNGLIVQAGEDVVSGEKGVLQSLPVVTCDGLSPSIVNYVHHSLESVILGNAVKDGPYTNDPHVLNEGCKSILCIPVRNKGTLACILYMENNLAVSAFTPDRLEILRVITAQAAISLQNARLYEEITHEMSVRKKAEDDLRTSEEKFRTILEEMQDAYCEVDLKGGITFVNPYACSLSGYQSSELIGKNIRTIVDRLEAPAEQADLERYYLAIFRTGKPGKPLACLLTCKQGEKIPLEIVTSPMRDKTGEIVGFRNVGRDVSERHRLENDLMESARNVQAARTATILGLAKLAEYRDEDTGAHLERIREYARIITTELSTKTEYSAYITSDYIEDIYNSSILHDIGKVGVPDAILLKTGKLDGTEFEAIKTHSDLGGEALKAVEAKIQGQTFLTLGKEIAFYHHERWDGTGYPKGLKGKDIPLSARIVALADVYDALTSKRTYKEAYSHEKALDIIVKDRGTHFDPDVVDAFLANADHFRKIREDLHED